jgi:hypothetical protein
MDMVWKQGLDEWKPAGQIDGLFERRSGAPEAQEALAPPAESFRATQQKSRAPSGSDGNWPGAPRRSFLLISLIFPVVWHFVLGIASPFLLKQFGTDPMGSILPFVEFVPAVVLIFVGLSRLLNLGMSRWWFIANFIPVLNLWLGYRCFACPAGYAHHKKMDAPGIVLAILYWLMILLGILILAAAVAVFFGMIDQPELKEQLREAIHNAVKS